MNQSKIQEIKAQIKKNKEQTQLEKSLSDLVFQTQRKLHRLKYLEVMELLKNVTNEKKVDDWFRPMTSIRYVYQSDNDSEDSDYYEDFFSD
jgi:hypothetical protein